MSKPIGSLVQELRTYVKAELLKFVKEFDVDYWVDLIVIGGKNEISFN